MIRATARIGLTLNHTLDLSCQVICGSVGDSIFIKSYIMMLQMFLALIVYVHTQRF